MEHARDSLYADLESKYFDARIACILRCCKTAELPRSR
jgi:hypothetical protein